MDTPTLPELPAANVSAPAVVLQDGEKVLAVLCHVSFFIGGGFILPLIIYLVKRDESAYVKWHAAQVLNFHISLLIYAICAVPLVFVLVGIPMLIVIGLVGLVCAIVGAIRAWEGAYYFYPLTIRFVS